MLGLISEIRRISDLVASEISPASQTLMLLKSLEEKQNAIDQRLSLIFKGIGTIEKNYKALVDTKDQWVLLEQQISILETEVSQLRELSATGALSKNPCNCDGMLGYEAEGAGDGLLGSYFNNEDFLGKTVDRTDEDVNFIWENECPAPTINEENFSVKWATWLRVPTTGKYTFYTESDDGNSLYVNGKSILSHFMGASRVSGSTKANSWLDENVGEFQKGKKVEVTDNLHREEKVSTSGQIYLNGGMKYSLNLLFFHSVHNSNDDSPESTAKLYWSSDQLEKQLIDPNFFYTSNKIPPLKISGLNPTTMQLSALKENENAFKDSTEFKLQDIPFQYQNKPSILLNLEYADDSISLTSTAAISFYIAVDANHANPLPTEFQFQQEGLSILKVQKNAKVVDNKVKASETVLFKIYRRKFPAGKIHIPLLKSPKTPTHRLIVFYSMDPAASSPISCGGETVLLSDPSGPVFQKCDVSSKYPDEGWNCEGSFSGKLVDNAESMWASNGQGMGAWISVKFKGPYQVTMIQVKDRANSNERNSKLEISFGNTGVDPVEIELKNIDEVQEFTIPPVVTSELKITVKSIYAAINNGGAFNIYGIACMDPNKLGGAAKSSLSQSEGKKKAMKLSCSDTFRNRDEFERLNIKEGDSIKVVCEETCALSNVAIYGDGIYSEDSSICKAAFHAGAISKAGDKVKLAVVRGESYYKSADRSGINSQAKRVSGVGIQFEAIKSKENAANIKAGMKVDVLDGKLKRWLPGIVEAAERVNQKSTKITIKKEGYGPEANVEIQWPNPERVTYCGEMIKDRNCDKNSTNPESLASEKIKIAFGPGPNKLEGYTLDDGKAFGKKGQLEYGWSRDVSNLARTRNVNSDPLNDNLILFPPDIKSHWCTDPKSQIACESVDWTLKVLPGKYNVKVTVGDAKYKTQFDLKINEKKVLDNKVLNANQFFTTNDDIIVLNGVLQMKTDCAGECKYSWSRVSAVEINKIKGLLYILFNYLFYILIINFLF